MVAYRTAFLLASLGVLASHAAAATDVRVNFTLQTADPYGNPLQENRYYYVYRPGTLPMTTPAPMLLILEDSPNTGPETFFHAEADRAGFILVSCSFSGNSSGTPGSGWTADDPRIVGYEDHDYLTAVINQVSASYNGTDAFIAGVSKGGHMSLAYACVRPSMIKAAASIDEFMGLTSNIPSAPMPILFMHGTADAAVPYTMVKDTADAWRAVDGLLNVTPVTTDESSPLMPGMVSQTTWRDPGTGLQVAFVTIIGGTHGESTPTVQTGYDSSVGLWNFFSQFLTPAQDSPAIVSQPVNNVQISGQPASFWVVASASSPVGYQWQENGIDIPGATSNWYTTPATALTDNGAKFRAVITNDSGSVTSAPATLTVKAAPADPATTAQPSDQAAVAGQPVSFTVSAAGTPPLTYQWRKNGVNIAGATAPELDLAGALTSDCGATFSVMVTSGSGSPSGSNVSTRATLTVTLPPGAPIILANPARARVLLNQQGTFSVTAWSMSPMTYQWQKGTITGNMADIPGATDASYTTPPAMLTDSLTMFRCTVTNAAGSVTSADELLFVTAANVAPSAFASLLTASAQTGVPFAYTIASSGGTTPITYSAQPLPAGLSVDAGSGLISGIPTAAGATNIVMGAANGAGHTSATLTLTVTDAPPVISIDDWRIAHFGAAATNPAIAGDLADPDGDGYANADEFTFGSDPLNSASVPTALTVTPSAFDFDTVGQATFTITNTGAGAFSGTAIPLNSASVPTALTVTPSAFDFDTVGQATFTITNTGPGPFSGTAIPLNSASVPTALSVAPSAFAFDAVGQATFTITNTGPGPFSGTAIPLNSASVPTALTVAPSAFAFDAVGQATFTITNTGAGAFSGTAIPPNSASVPTALTVAPSAFAFDAVGQATFTITNTGAGTFSGTAIPPNSASVPTALTVAPSAFAFDAVGQATFTITNTGAGTFSGTAITNCAAFSIVSGGSFTVPPDGSAQVVVGFTPPGVGVFHGQLTLQSNGGSATVSLTGTGP